MRREILRVNDIQQAIDSNGLEIYVDRLLQDASGAYFYLDVCAEPREGYTKYTIPPVDEYSDPDGGEIPVDHVAYYRIAEIPKELAWFVISALRLQSQVMSLGREEYPDGPHKGHLTYVAFETGRYGKSKVLHKDCVRLETL